MGGKKNIPEYESIDKALKWPKHVRILLLLSFAIFFIGVFSFLALFILNITIDPIWGGPAAYLSVSIIGSGIGLLTLTFFLAAEDSLKRTPLMFRAAALLFICGLMLPAFFTVPPAAKIILDYAQGDYVETSGIPQNIKTYTNKTKTKWVDRFEIDGVTIIAKPMDIKEKDLSQNDGDQTLRVRYFPRSKFAIFIETSGGTVFKK